jgi:hypothetical protein
LDNDLLLKIREIWKEGVVSFVVIRTYIGSFPMAFGT